MFTLQDALREKQHICDMMFTINRTEESKERQEKVIMEILKARPEIGVLQRGQRKVFYTYNSKTDVYREADDPTLLC